MATSKLQIEAEELRKIVNPFGDVSLLTIGDIPPAMSAADVESVIEAEEQSILSALPERYREVISGTVDGEFLTNKQYGASAGQNVFTLSLAPVVADTLLLFKNYKKPWRERSRSDALSTASFTLTESTGQVQLAEPLAAGETLIAYYKHTSGRTFVSVRQLVLKSARIELHQMFPNWNGSEAIISAGRDAIDQQLFAYGAGPVPKGIGEIDSIQFVEDPRTGPGTGATLRLPFMGGRS